ncbi:unnamed protein product [Adineta ricciae]|uniref:C2H2-type domain-containing protein n=1 Tax=Adineta ricciae TaxID=249248 RepID=A0A814RI55_ADIRI|nr:unnamed protein product [Adineta ricciae]
MFRHITLYHQSEPNFRMVCDLHKACGVLYRTYAAYKSHVYRKHLTELHSTEKYDNNTFSTDDQRDSTNFDNENDSLNGDDDPEMVLSNDFGNHILSFNLIDEDEETIFSIKNIKKSYTLFMLQLREEFLLPKNVTNMISIYIGTLLHQIEILSGKLAFNYPVDSPPLGTASIQHQNKKAIQFDQLILLLKDIRNAVEFVTKNEYQFVKHCIEYFGFVPVDEIVVSSPNEVNDCGYFIPIDKTLSSMLNSQSLALKVLENIHQQQLATESDSDLMFSIRDGYHGLKLDDDHLLLQLYLDDIGLTNPLGSKRDQHKMSMIYFTIEDIPEQYRSKLDFIQLVAICESRILKLHGLLVNGVQFKFTFSTVVADNLAANWLGGFQSTFSNGFFCRRCYSNYPDRISPAPLEQINSRTIVDHDDLVKEILNDPHKSPRMGVVGESPLNDLIGFHPTMSLPGDCMHDFLEGYGYFDTSNRPPPIQVKHLQNDRVIATASQKLCLFKLFPVIFHDLIDQLSSFIVYKILREILDLVLSYPFRKSWLPVLGDLCFAFHKNMLLHFPDKITPKVHFVREYERIIHDYGPATRQWCLRYEAQHAYFKKLSVRTNNFKNTPKMLATHFRPKQCLKFIRFSKLQDGYHSVGMKKIHNTSFNVSMRNALLDHFGNINFNSDFFQCGKLINENIEYCRAAVYVVQLKSDNEQPLFGQIVFILKMNEKWWLLMDILNTVYFYDNLFAWNVKSVERYLIIDPCQLKYYCKGLDIYYVNNSSFVTLTGRLTSY